MPKFNLAELIVKFTGDTTGLDKAIDKSEKSVGAFSVNIGKIAAIAGAAAIGIGALAAAQANVIDQNNDLARSLGVSNAALTEMSYVARFSGVDIGQLSSAIGLMQRTIGEAAGGAETAIDSLAKIGLTVQDLINLSPDQQFALIAEKIGSIQNPAERTAVAMDLFGRSGRALNDVFENYSVKLQDAKKFTSAFSLALTEIDVAKVTDAKDEWEKLGLVFDGIKNQLAVELAPAAGSAAKAISDAALQAIENWQTLKYLLSTTFPKIPDSKVGLNQGKNPAGEFPYGVNYGPSGTSEFETKNSSVFAPLKIASGKAKKEDTKAIKEAEDAAKLLLKQQEEIIKKNQEIANSAADAFSSFTSSVIGGKNALQSLKSTAIQVINDIVSNMFRISFGGTTSGGFAGGLAASILKGVGGLFGGGGGLTDSFGLGGLAPYANGGVVNKTTMFPIGTNTGMMGEKGPEAIMPLTRVGGKLAVQSTGGSGTNVTQNLNFSTGINQSVREEILRLMPQIEKAAVSGVKKAQNRGAF